MLPTDFEELKTHIQQNAPKWAKEGKTFNDVCDIAEQKAAELGTTISETQDDELWDIWYDNICEHGE